MYIPPGIPLPQGILITPVLLYPLMAFPLSGPLSWAPRIITGLGAALSIWAGEGQFLVLLKWGEAMTMVAGFPKFQNLRTLMQFPK